MMQKIKFTSHMLHLFFRALCWIIPIVMTYFILFHIDMMATWGDLSSIASTIPPGSIPDLSSFTLGHRFAVLATEALSFSITVLICHQLAKLFLLYEQGYLFEEENIRLIKSISIYMIIGQVVQLIYQPLMTIILTINNPVGERFASMTFGTTNLSTLLTAFIILIVSWIVKEAQQLKSDVQLTI